MEDNKELRVRLARILTIQIIIFSGFLTILTTSYQLSSEYKTDLEEVQTKIDQTQSGYIQSLSFSVWNYNEEQVNNIAKGIKNIPGISYVEIKDKSANYQTKQGAKLDKNFLHGHLAIQYKDKNKLHDIGSFYIQSSKKPSQDRLKERAWIVFFSQGIQIFFVSIFIILMVRFSITKHLDKLAQYLSKVDPKKLGNPLILNKKVKGDEIDLVAGKINRLHSDLHTSYQELEELNENLENLVTQRTYELNQAMTRNENLLRVIVHDVGNPLSAVMFGIDRIARQIKDPNKQPDMKKINLMKENCDKIVEILNHVKEIKALESGKKSLELEKVDLVPVFENLKSQFSHHLGPKKIELKGTFSETPFYLMAEKVSLSHNILGNLISNAIKFSHEGSHIDITADKDADGKVTIEVINYNAKIPDQIIDKLFDPTANTSRAGIRGEKGTGFGLPIVKMFTQYNKGSIFVNSTEEKTTFHLEFLSPKSEEIKNAS